MKDRVEGFVLVLVIAVLFAIVAVSVGGRELVRRIAHTRQLRAEYARRRQAAAHVTATVSRLDLAQVRLLRLAHGPNASAAEIYAAAVERIRDQEGRTPSPARLQAIDRLCRSEITAPPQQLPESA